MFFTSASFIDPVGFEYDPNITRPPHFTRIPVATSWYTFED